MSNDTVGEWDDYETWQLQAHIFDLQNTLIRATREIQRRAKIEKSRFTRIERYEQIKRLLADGNIRTTSQIAKALRMSPSQHLRDILCELYRDGTILGYAESAVAHHPIYHWYVQGTLPLPSPDFQRMAVCESVTESVDFPF